MSALRRTVRRYDGVAQIAIVLGGVAGYELARIAIRPNWPAAIYNARRVFDLERLAHLSWEQPLQRWFLGLPEFVEAMNAFYFLGHFVLTGIFFWWLYRRSRSGFRLFRDGFLVATIISILVHWKFPTAPPRLAGVGLEDTLRVFSDIDIGSRTSAALSNPVAAVPSLHAGYALGVGIGMVLFGRALVTRVLGVVYPIVIVLTIVVTGNHFILDAIAGMAVLVLGLSLARLRGPVSGEQDVAILPPAPRGGAVR